MRETLHLIDISQHNFSDSFKLAETFPAVQETPSLSRVR